MEKKDEVAAEKQDKASSGTAPLAEVEVAHHQDTLQAVRLPFSD